MSKPFVLTALLAAALALPVAEAAQREKGERAEKSDTGGKLSRQDRKFIDNAMRSNHAELAIAQIAQDKASNPEVKRYAERLIADHGKAGSELEGIVSKLGYQPSKKAQEGHKGDAKKFAKMGGDKFDREFARQMVKDHEKTIKLFKEEAQDGQAQELWQFAQKTLPTLEEHLRIARQLSGDRSEGRERRERKRKDS